MIKMLLDTDIGNDTDDCLALSYLIKQTECDLVGITTVSGDTLKRAKIAKSICNAAGENSIPVYAGFSNPLFGGGQDGPLWTHDKAMSLAPCDAKYGETPFDAILFMRDTILKNPNEITVVAIGMLTNIAVLFTAFPEVIPLIKEVIIMGGSFFENPRCTWDIRAEWNIMCDAAAAKKVMESDVRSISVLGVDLTWDYKLSREEVLEIFAPAPKLKITYDTVDCNKEAVAFWFHDPLTCALPFYKTRDTFGEYVDGKITVSLSEKSFAVTSINPCKNGNARVYRNVSGGISNYFEHYKNVIQN